MERVKEGNMQCDRTGLNVKGQFVLHADEEMKNKDANMKNTCNFMGTSLAYT